MAPKKPLLNKQEVGEAPIELRSLLLRAEKRERDDQ